MDVIKIQTGQAGRAVNSWSANMAVAGPKIHGQPNASLAVASRVEASQLIGGHLSYSDIETADTGLREYALHPITDEVAEQARQRIEDLETAVRLAVEMHARAIDELLQYAGTQMDDQDGLRRQLFSLYREGLITKADVRKRGNLGPAEFHEEMHRLARESRALAG